MVMTSGLVSTFVLTSIEWLFYITWKTDHVPSTMFSVLGRLVRSLWHYGHSVTVHKVGSYNVDGDKHTNKVDVIML